MFPAMGSREDTGWISPRSDGSETAGGVSLHPKKCGSNWQKDSLVRGDASSGSFPAPSGLGFAGLFFSAVPGDVRDERPASDPAAELPRQLYRCWRWPQSDTARLARPHVKPWHAKPPSSEIKVFWQWLRPDDGQRLPQQQAHLENLANRLLFLNRKSARVQVVAVNAVRLEDEAVL